MAAGWQDRVMCDGMDHWMRFAIFFFLNEFEIIGFFLQGEEGREGGREGKEEEREGFFRIIGFDSFYFLLFFRIIGFSGNF